MKSDCIFLGMLAALFAIPFFDCLIKIVSGRYIRHEDSDLVEIDRLKALIVQKTFYIACKTSNLNYNT